MIRDCKKCEIKSVLNEMVQDRKKRKHNKLGYISLENKSYEDIINIQTTNDEESEESDAIHLRKVTVQEEIVETAKKSIV